MPEKMLTCFVYLGIEIGRLKARQKYLQGLPSNATAALEAGALGAEIESLEKMQNAHYKATRKGGE